LNSLLYYTQMDLPQKWMEIGKGIPQSGGIVMVIGKTDTGKSTLIQYLLSCGLKHGRRVAIVDSDIGQATFGPPTCLSLSFWKSAKGKESRNPRNGEIHIEEICTYRALKFIGSFSPVGFLLQVVVGVSGLVAQAIGKGMDLILVDTSGLIQGRAGFLLKRHKIELIRPNHLIILQKKEELENFMNYIPTLPGMNISRVPRSPDGRIRSLEERRSYRTKQFFNYFQDGRARWIHFSNQKKLLPGCPPFEGMLVGLLSSADETLGLGVISRIGRKSLEIITPLPILKRVRRVEPSSIRLEKDFWKKKDGKPK